MPPHHVFAKLQALLLQSNGMGDNINSHAEGRNAIDHRDDAIASRLSPSQQVGVRELLLAMSTLPQPLSELPVNTSQASYQNWLAGAMPCRVGDGAL
jgi:hypothetical protein